MEHDFNDHGNKEPEYSSYDFIKYNTGMKLTGSKTPEGREASLT